MSRVYAGSRFNGLDTARTGPDGPATPSTLYGAFYLSDTKHHPPTYTKFCGRDPPSPDHWPHMVPGKMNVVARRAFGDSPRR